MAEISKITLPSGNTYDIKDATAREMISGGVSFIIAWDGTSTPTVANIPEGVQVVYQGTTYTGTLAAEGEGGAQPGAFYLVKSKPVYTHVKGDSAPTFVANKYYSYNSGTDTYTALSSQPSDWTTNYKNYYENADGSDAYDEYVPVGTAGSKTWEKIGDTQIDLSDVVTGVSLTKQTATVITGLGTPTTANVIGANATFTVTQPTITVTPTQTYIEALSNGTVSALTGLGTPTTDTFVKSVEAETGKNLVTTSITPTNGTESVSKVTKTANKLVTTTVPNVTGNTEVSIPNVTGNTSVTIPNVTGNTDVSASNITSNSSVTANLSNWTFTMGSGADAETLIIGGGNGSTVTATNTAYSSVTASKVTLGTALSASKVTLGTALTATNTTLGTAKTVATGALSSTGTGDDVTSTITISDKTVAKQGTAVTVATGATSETGTGDAVVTGVTIGTSGAAITALGTPTSSTVLTGVKLATNSSSGTNRVQVATGITSANATGGNVAWNSKDQKSPITVLGTETTATVLTNATDVTVTKGSV